MAERLSVSVSEDYLFEALSRDPSLEVLRWDLSGPAPREVIDLVIPDYLAAKSRLARLSGVRRWCGPRVFPTARVFLSFSFS